MVSKTLSDGNLSNCRMEPTQRKRQELIRKGEFVRLTINTILVIGVGILIAFGADKPSQPTLALAEETGCCCMKKGGVVDDCTDGSTKKQCDKDAADLAARGETRFGA
jgi:hypothetical protein